MDNWLNDLNIEREQASKRFEEIKAKQQAFSALSKVQGSDKNGCLFKHDYNDVRNDGMTCRTSYLVN